MSQDLPEPAAISAKDALRDLKSLRCACGARKNTMQTLCRAHYFRLPRGLRQALYDRIGEGYEDAYARALDYLQIKRPPTPEDAR